MDYLDIAVKQQDEIRVFLNDNGDISIVQEPLMLEGHIIVVNVENAPILAQAILSCHAKAVRGE